MPEKRLLKSGDVLFYQGAVPERIFLLNGGELEVLLAASEYAGLDSGIILDKSSRVLTMSGKAMLVGFSENLTSPYRNSLRAVGDCEIIEYPIVPGGFKGVASGDLSGSIKMLRQIFNIFMQAQGNLRKCVNLQVRLSQIDDNLSLLFHSLGDGSSFPDIADKAEKLYGLYSAGGGKIPDSITADFLVQDNSTLLNKKYGADMIREAAGKEYLDLVKNILKLEPQILGHIFKSNPAISVSLFNEISRCCGEVFENSYEVLKFSEEKITSMMDTQKGWAGYFSAGRGSEEWTSTGRISATFFKNFIKLLNRVDTICSPLSGQKLGANAGYELLVSSLQSPLGSSAVDESSPASGAGDSNAGEAIGAPAVISTGLQKSIYQIFEFSMIEKEFQNQFLKLLNDFKTMKNPLSSEVDGRKIRRHITTLYWDLYKQVFVRTKIESSVPRPVKLMMNYGFLDDQMLEPEQLRELNELARMREFASDIPVIGENEFLSKIYSGKVEPSITEMGLTYEGFLREQDKYSRSKKGDKTAKSGEEEDLNLEKTLHEIGERVASTVAVCSGSTSTAFPILTSDVIKGSLMNFYQSKENVAAIVKKLVEIDFSAFYRETVLKLDSAREIIKEGVDPYFIILPSYGTRTLLWQEVTGNNKRSRGRIVIPAFFMGDLEKSLMHTIACFRWELNRTVKGAMWADPIDGGITGEYFDYVNTYKKNSKLSQEAKETIKIRFKSLRTNRDRFADDYTTWVGYEREGIMKLNSVVREMFFKHVPFQQETREKLENMPAFNKYANRYKNVKNKEIAAYERRFKKYQDEAGNYPAEIEKYFEFLKK